MLSLLLLAACAALSRVVFAKVPVRDCYTGEPPFCNNSLAQDPTCRGLSVTSLDGWERMDCDYVLYNVPATKRQTKKWIVIHSGACDDYTAELGNYFAPEMQLNLFGLRPCGGFEDSLCANRHDYDTCTAFHTSWNFPPELPTYAPYGYGFNPPALVDIYHTAGSNLMFLHEYGTANTSYNWYSADGCNAYTKPLYLCVAGIDPNYTAKFQAMKALLEPAFANSTLFPCNLEVVDTMPYAQDQVADIPCTGILRGYNEPSKVGGDVSNGTAHNWAWEMPGFMTRAIEIATRRDPKGVLIQAYQKALNIALCKNFAANQTACQDDDMTWS